MAEVILYSTGFTERTERSEDYILLSELPSDTENSQMCCRTQNQSPVAYRDTLRNLVFAFFAVISGCAESGVSDQSSEKPGKQELNPALNTADPLRANDLPHPALVGTWQ